MILLNFDTAIAGESTVTAHTAWIVLESFQMGVSRQISVIAAGDRDTSNPSFNEVSCSKSTDIASAGLFSQAISGKGLGNATFHFIQTGGAGATAQVFLTIILANAIISSYSTSSSGERPTENFTINFTNISYQYNKFSGEAVTAGTPTTWNLATNAPT